MVVTLGFFAEPKLVRWVTTVGLPESHKPSKKDRAEQFADTTTYRYGPVVVRVILITPFWYWGDKAGGPGIEA